MNQFYLFLIRAFLGAFFAVLLSRFFFKDVNPAYVAGLAIFLVAMAYGTEYFRNRKRQ